MAISSGVLEAFEVGGDGLIIALAEGFVGQGHVGWLGCSHSVGRRGRGGTGEGTGKLYICKRSRRTTSMR